MSDHAFLAPSNAATWVKCSLSPHMVKRYPQGDSEDSADGDAAHWCNAQASPVVGMRAPNGVLITEAMLHGRGLWHKAAIATGVQQWNVEQRLPATPSFGAHVWGTPDLWGVNGRVLHVLDYKFGHDAVEVFENWQLIVYTALILAALDLPDLHTAVHLTIVQPRGYHREGPVRHWYLPQASDLRAYWNILRAAADAAEQDPKGTPGTHCRHCPGRHSCQALQSATWLSVDKKGDAIPNELTPNELAYELREVRRAIKMLQARATGLEAQAESHLMAGTRVPGFAMQPNKPRERWIVPVEQVKQYGRAFGLALTKEEPITPQQARDLGAPEAIVNALSERPRGTLGLVEDDGSFTRKVFSNGK
jgi:hypothetical protein